MRARTWFSGLSATALVTGALVVGSGSLSTANATGPTPQPAGTLTLATAAGTATTDGWTYDNNTASTSDDVTQAVGAATDSCLLAPVAGSLVTTSANNGWSPGFANHRIGVTQSSAITRSCNTVNVVRTTVKWVTTRTPESLTVKLNGSALSDPLFGAAQATGATLDVLAKDDTAVTATLSLAGATVGTYTLWADESPKFSPPAGQTYCKTGEDDSDDGDFHSVPTSCAWSFSGVNFDAITLTATQGAFSLSGGGEWGASAASHRTTFSLVKFFDGTLDCTTANVATANGNGGSITGIALTRLDNGDPAQGCVALPYDLGVDGSTATFHKPNVSSQSTAQFAVQVSRHYTAPAPYPVPAPLVDWEDGNGNHPVPLCPAGFIGGIDANGNPTGVNYASLGTGDDQSPADGIQYACVYKPGAPSYNISNGSLDITDSIYFTGDIKFPTP
jgi:hypothetical protein